VNVLEILFKPITFQNKQCMLTKIINIDDQIYIQNNEHKSERIQHKFNYIVERQVEPLESIIGDTKKLYESYVDKHNRVKLLKNILRQANRLYFRSCALNERKLIEEEKFECKVMEDVNFKEAI
jgi:hypothetical protein